jgi:hypothetical protein
MTAGASAAFVRRPGSLWSIPLETPEIVGTDLREIADQLVG